MGQGFNIDIQSKEIDYKHKMSSMIISNIHYLSCVYCSLVDIYNLHQNNLNLTYKTSIFCESYVNHIDFHPNYHQLILTSLSNSEIKLWQISDENKECKYSIRGNS